MKWTDAMLEKKAKIVGISVMIIGALVIAYTYVTKGSFLESDSVFGAASFLFGIRCLIAVPGKERDLDPHKKKMVWIIQILAFLLAIIGVILILS